jgi:hypothetical protein
VEAVELEMEINQELMEVQVVVVEHILEQQDQETLPHQVHLKVIMEELGLVLMNLVVEVVELPQQEHQLDLDQEQEEQVLQIQFQVVQ